MLRNKNEYEPTKDRDIKKKEWKKERAPERDRHGEKERVMEDRKR